MVNNHNKNNRIARAPSAYPAPHKTSLFYSRFTDKETEANTPWATYPRQDLDTKSNYTARAINCFAASLLSSFRDLGQGQRGSTTVGPPNPGTPLSQAPLEAPRAGGAVAIAVPSPRGAAPTGVRLEVCIPTERSPRRMFRSPETTHSPAGSTWGKGVQGPAPRSVENTPRLCSRHGEPVFWPQLSPLRSKALRDS